MIPEEYLDSVINIWTERGETHVFSISGNSMAPLIKHGDAVVIEHGSRNFHTGDVLVFKTPEKFLAHRLIHRKNSEGGETFLCKGDNCSTFDLPVSAEHILGKVVEVMGPEGSLYFKSDFWRALNYLLTILSLASQARHETDSFFWKGICCIFDFGSKILTKNFSIRNILLKVLLEAGKIKIYIQGVGLRQEQGKM